MKRLLSPLGDWSFSLSQSALQAVPQSETIDMDEAALRAARVFGISGWSRAARVGKSMEEILAAAPAYFKDALEFADTFKCEAKRSDKAFPLKSPEICAEVD